MTKRERDELDSAAKRYAGDAFIKLVCDGEHEDPLHQLATIALDMMITRAPQAEHQNFNLATGGYLNNHDPTLFDLYDAVDQIFAGFPPRPNPGPVVEHDDIPF